MIRYSKRLSNPIREQRRKLAGKLSFLTLRFSKVEHERDDFVGLRGALEWKFDKTWPIKRWFSTWHRFTRELLHFHDQTLNKGNDIPNNLAEFTKVWDLTQPEIFAGRWSGLLPLDVLRTALLVGPAGAGKSHTLARGVELAWRQGAPALLFLGQHIVHHDPRISIIEHLELRGWSFHELLCALNMMAEAAQTRGLVVIDALNEGIGREVWREHLKSFCHEVDQHERLCLIVSCRAEYLDYVVPTELIADRYLFRPDMDSGLNSSLGKLVEVKVNGFQTQLEREMAMRVYMDGNGIARPTAPILDAEFFNPLFLSSMCRSMAHAGLKSFPPGLDGRRKLFEFVLNAKAKHLGTRHDDTSRVKAALLSSLDELAGEMVKGERDYVELDQANSIVEAAFKTLRIEYQSWLEVLEGADILRRDVIKRDDSATTWQRPEELIRFSFERLQDQLMAQWLVKKWSDFARAFGAEGVSNSSSHERKGARNQP